MRPDDKKEMENLMIKHSPVEIKMMYDLYQVIAEFEAIIKDEEAERVSNWFIDRLFSSTTEAWERGKIKDNLKDD